MPVYTYQCTQCAHTVDVTHGINEHPKLACEKCGGLVKRAVGSPVNVIYGSGFAGKDAVNASASKPDTDKCDHDHDHHHHDDETSDHDGTPCHWDHIDEIVKEIESRPEPDPEREP